MKITLILSFALLTLFVSSPISQAATGIDEVTSLRSKLRATVEHMALNEESEASQSHWLLINEVPWKWDESALVFSGSFVNTNYKRLAPSADDKNVINFDF
ncbi:MAG: hypothetical protein ACK551_02695 [Vampirovibrionales bacterium]